jgi:hypothetical protein
LLAALPHFFSHCRIASHNNPTRTAVTLGLLLTFVVMIAGIVVLILILSILSLGIGTIAWCVYAYSPYGKAATRTPAQLPVKERVLVYLVALYPVLSFIGELLYMKATHTFINPRLDAGYFIHFGAQALLGCMSVSVAWYLVQHHRRNYLVFIPTLLATAFYLCMITFSVLIED